jgi:hypothetical protein
MPTNVILGGIGGAGLGALKASKQNAVLKKMDNETDDEFKARKRMNIITGTGLGAGLGAGAVHGITSKNQMQTGGMVAGLISGEIASSGGSYSLKDMDAEDQQALINRQRAFGAGGALLGGTAGRMIGSDKIPGLNKKASHEERLIHLLSSNRKY